MGLKIIIKSLGSQRKLVTVLLAKSLADHGWNERVLLRVQAGFFNTVLFTLYT